MYHTPDIHESWRAHVHFRKYAHVLLEVDGRVSWTVRRRGEIAPWHPARTVEDAKYLAEIALEDMPDIGPLED